METLQAVRRHKRTQSLTATYMWIYVHIRILQLGHTGYLTGEAIVVECSLDLGLQETLDLCGQALNRHPSKYNYQGLADM